jgi:hypothetical protein
MRGAHFLMCTLAFSLFSIVDQNETLRFAVRNVSLHLIDIDLADGLFVVVRLVHMDIHNVFRDHLFRRISASINIISTLDHSSLRGRTTHPISSLVMLIFYDEDHVESTQDRRLEVDVLAWAAAFVITTPYWVRRREHTRAAVQHGCDSCLSNRNGLLLHGFVDGYTVLVSHLVELVNADDASVGENHGTAFEIEFTLWNIRMRG